MTNRLLFLFMTTKNEITPWSIFLVFLKLGLTSFGGPIAHLGFFREEFVHRKQWLNDKSYADLLALCQCIPGPASSQVGLTIGYIKGNYLGALSAWLGFTLPSAVILILFALGLSQFSDILPAYTLYGLKLAALAVVAQAIIGMAKQFCRHPLSIAIALISCCAMILFVSHWTQIVIIVMAGFLGLLLKKIILPQIPSQTFSQPLSTKTSHKAAIILLILFFALMVILPFLARVSDAHGLKMFDAFYRSGALVFGGGHVVLPLLETETVSTQWIKPDTFVAGYAAAQAVPGPLFTFAGFLGASMEIPPSGMVGGSIALIAIFLPSFLLVIGILPYWEHLRRNITMQTCLYSVNAAVVGLLLAVFYDPLWVESIHGVTDMMFALLIFSLLYFFKQPPWLIVCGTGFIAGLSSFFIT